MTDQQKYIYGETLSSESPQPTDAVYVVLSQHLDPKNSEKDDSHETLNDVYKALVSTEQRVDSALSKLEQVGLITSEDVLAMVVLLAVSRTLGPDLDFLRQAIEDGNYQIRELQTQINGVGLDPTITEYLRDIILKLSAQNNNQNL